MPLIYAIPGIGTSSVLFAGISIPGHELKVLDWPEPLKHYTLGDYASEFLKQIDTSKGPVNLLGVSFGGMLCSELADRIATNKVVLISSCRSSSEFPPFLKLLRRFPVHRIIPEPFYRCLTNFAYTVKIKPPLRQEFFRMTSSMPAHYFYRCIGYIIAWPKTGHKPGIVSIHGTADRLLKYECGPREHTIANGTHAMIINRTEELNKILDAEFNGR